MIKGMSRRIIMVDAPGPELFDKAIFILRDGAESSGAEAGDMLKEAQRIADEYVKTNLKKKRRRLPSAVCVLIGTAIGAALSALAFILI